MKKKKDKNKSEKWVSERIKEGASERKILRKRVKKRKEKGKKGFLTQMTKKN